MGNSDNWEAEGTSGGEATVAVDCRRSGAAVEALAAGSTALGGACGKVGKVPSAHCHHQRRTGIVVFCGFSSIPASDFGVDLFKQQR